MTDYERGWTQWGDMIRHSPAPFHRRRLILKLADEVPFESVLDVGCGNGELLLTLSRRRSLRRLVGMDIAASVIDENRRAFPSFEFHRVDIDSAWLPIQCDLVVCSEVIEHLVAWERALVHLRRMCAGYLIVTVPAGRMFPIDRLMGHHRHFARETLCEAPRARRVRSRAGVELGFPLSHRIQIPDQSRARGERSTLFRRPLHPRHEGDRHPHQMALLSELTPSRLPARDPCPCRRRERATMRPWRGPAVP